MEERFEWTREQAVVRVPVPDGVTGPTSVTLRLRLAAEAAKTVTIAATCMR